MEPKKLISIKKESRSEVGHRNKSYKLNESSDGDMVYMCPHCKWMNFISVRYNVSLNSYDYPVSFQGEIKTTCYNCGKEFTSNLVGIDPNISTAIEFLNCIKYNTVSSCEGHVYEDGTVSIPYITFKTDNVIKDHGTPEGWRSRYENDGTVSIVYGKREDEDIVFDNIGEAKQKALTALNNWICSFNEDKVKENMNNKQSDN